MVDESQSAHSAPVSNPAGGLDNNSVPADPGFLERGGLRRRLRLMRKTRELAYRDLGGLVFEMHRLGQQRDDLLQGKLAMLDRTDSELRAIEEALRERRGVTVLREAGVTACPRCAAIHGSEDRFCPACGFSMGHIDRPIAATPIATPASVPPEATAAPTPPPGPPQPSGPPQPGPPQPPAPPQSLNPVQPIPQAPPEVDQPTEIIEPSTQIARPPAEGVPAKKSNRA